MFLCRRLVGGLITVLIASLIIFLAANALPGNVARAVLGKQANPASVKLLEEKLNLDQPLHVRFVKWLTGLLHGDLGQSASALATGAQQTSVARLIEIPLMNSVVLALITFALLVPLSLIVGTISGLRAGKPIDFVMSYSSLVLASLPEFVLGTFLITIFFSQLNLLPPLAQVPPGSSPLEHPLALILPVLTLLGVSLAFSSRQVRTGVIESLRHNYV